MDKIAFCLATIAVMGFYSNVTADDEVPEIEIEDVDWDNEEGCTPNEDGTYKLRRTETRNLANVKHDDKEYGSNGDGTYKLRRVDAQDLSEVETGDKEDAKARLKKKMKRTFGAYKEGAKLNGESVKSRKMLKKN